MQCSSTAESLLPCIQAEGGDCLIWGVHSSLKELLGADHVSYTGLKHWRQNLKVLVTQSCLDSLWPHGCTLPDSSVPEILPARILEWVAIPFSRGSSQPRDQTQVSWFAGRFSTIWATRETPLLLWTFQITQCALWTSIFLIICSWWQGELTYLN